MSKVKKWKYGTAGSIISGTMRPEDLIPSFCEELRSLGHRSKELTQIEKEQNKAGYYESEDSEYDLESLFNMLDSPSMPYFYFGSHAGDGSDYGFWLSELCIEDFDGLKVEDTSQVSDSYIGEVLHVNDHGNITLYNAKNGKLTEVWSLV